MSDRQTKKVYVDLEFREGNNLFNKFKEAWLEIPQESRNTAEVWDNHIVYDRLENDIEYAERQEQEKIYARKQEEKAAALKATHLSRELDVALNSALNNINNQWEQISTGQSMSLIASVPMPDGRIAAIKVDVIAKEPTKSD